MKIIVFVEGGIVQTVMTDKDAEVMVVDYDIEGVDLGELKIVNGDEAYIYVSEVHEIDKTRVHEIFALQHHEFLHKVYAPKSDIVQKVAEDAGIPVVEIKTEAPEDLKGLPGTFPPEGVPVPKGWSEVCEIIRNKDSDGAGIPDGVLPKALTSNWPRKEGDAKLFLDELRETPVLRKLPTEEHYCSKCHQLWATHNDDGSCIVD